MKKLRLLFLLLLTCNTSAIAQLTMEGSHEYGRIFDITYDDTVPNKLYAATMGNHLVVSENNGTTWELLYSFPQAEGIIKDLKLMPNKKLSFTVYNTALYHNASIYILDIVTLNLSNTYQIPIPATATSSSISAYDIYPTDSNVVMVQQYYEEGFAFKAKVYYTNDGGVTWSVIYDIADNYSIFPANVAINPNNPVKLFIACMGGLSSEHIGGLLISENAGADWTEKLPGIDFKSIAFKPGNPNEILLGTTIGSQTQNLFKTNDGGINWIPVIGNWTDNVSDAVTAIKYNPYNPNNIIILAEKDIITTTDNWASYNFYHHATGIFNPEANNNYYYGTNASFNPFAPGEIFISANYFPLFSTNGGATVTRVKQPYFTSLDFNGYVTANNQSHLYYGVQRGFVHKDMTTLTQTPAFVISLGGFTSWSAKFFIDQQVAGRTYNFVSAMLGAGLNISNDHGATNLQVPIAYSFMEAIASKPDNPNIIWYAASDYSGVSALYELNISDPSNIQQLSITLPEEGFVSTLYFNPNNAEEKWIALGSRIYKFAEGATTWEHISIGLESLENGMGQIYQILQNPLAANEMALATNQGIFTSQDAGTTWTYLDSFPNERVNFMAYSTTSAGQMIAVTYNAQFNNFALRHSSDAGQNWNEVPEENLAYIASYAAACKFEPNTATVYINTTDLGVVSHTIDFTQLDIPDMSINESFTVLYPNPASDYINLQLKNESLSKADIFSITGQKIMESTDTKLNVSSLQKGIYLVKIKTMSGNTITQKFIKK